MQPSASSPAQRPWYKNWKVIVGIVVGVAIIGAILDKQKDKTQTPTGAQSSSSAPSQQASSESSSPAPAPTPLTITASTLYDEYEANEVAADGKYKGKILSVSGTVDSIGKDLTNTMYVALSNGKAYSITGVQCFFGDEHQGALAKLNKGQKVTITGRCDGKFGNVLLKDSKVQ